MSREAEVEKFNRDGYLVIEDFATDEEVDSMRAACHVLVDEMNPAEHHTIFSTTQLSFRDDYFINSQDKLGYFFEDGALGNDGNLAVDKHGSLNKIGHAMHVLCPAFRKFTFSDKVKEVVKNIGFEDPIVAESMYIFKPPHIGGEVVPHQDATFLYETPLKLVGLWLALEDTTLENGCMWFIPGSHKGGIDGDYRMIRNPEKEGPSCIFTGTKPTYDDSQFVCAPVKKGSLVCIHGLVAHKSAQNTSDISRHIYTFHLYEGTSEWSEQNWLQPTKANTFTHMNDVML